MDFQQFQVNSFSPHQFGGNPAAVVPLESWLPEHIMQAIAAENNLSETAFFVRQQDGFGLRWFTPEVEVDLCGHATLASAHVLFSELNCEELTLRFHTRSGELLVTCVGQTIQLDFPAQEFAGADISPAVASALGGKPIGAYSSPSNIYMYASEAEVRALQPGMGQLLAATNTTTIVTAAGDQVDFVSRFFGPQVGINEDPVTGSAHCALVPLWAERLGKNTLTACQVSAREGYLDCELVEPRVLLRGRARTFLRGTITIDI